MTVATAAAAGFESGEARAAVRLRPAPPLDPPYDHERANDPHTVCTGQLAIRPAPRPTQVARVHPCSGAPTVTTTPPAVPTPQAPAVPAPRPRRGPASRVAPIGDVQGESCAAAYRFVDACVEVLNGYRPVVHLRTYTTPQDYVRVADQLTRRAVRLRMAPAHRRGTPRPTPPHPRTEPDRVVLQRLWVCEPHAGTVEAAVVLGHGEGSWAMAVRLERRHRRQWHCTLMQVI